MNQFYSGGRVGRSPYRDHNISRIILVSGGLDTPRHASTALALRSARRGYSTTDGFYK